MREHGKSPAFQPGMIEAGAGRKRMVLGIDQGYAPVTEDMMTVGERHLVDRAMVAGVEMRDADGFRRPFLVPPAVALAIVRAISAGHAGTCTACGAVGTGRGDTRP